MILIGAIALALLGLPPGWGLALVGVAIAIEVAEVAFWIRFLRRYRVRTGIEGLIGSPAEVIETCDPRGSRRPARGPGRLGDDLTPVHKHPDPYGVEALAGLPGRHRSCASGILDG